MSIYAALDGEIVTQIASNRGWGDVCRWARKLGSGYGELLNLCKTGLSENLSTLRGEIAYAVKESKPDDDTMTVIKNLVSIIDDRGPTETVLTITDGMGPE